MYIQASLFEVENAPTSIIAPPHKTDRGKKKVLEHPHIIIQVMRNPKIIKGEKN